MLTFVLVGIVVAALRVMRRDLESFSIKRIQEKAKGPLGEIPSSEHGLSEPRYTLQGGNRLS